MALGPGDLKAFIDERGIDARLHTELPRVHTVREAAEVMGVGTDAVAKSVVCMSEEGPVVVFARGDVKVHERAVVDLLGTRRKVFRLARGPEVEAATGYLPGAVPPIGFANDLTCLMDERLVREDKVFFGGGADDALLEIAPRTVVEMTGATIGPFTR